MITALDVHYNDNGSATAGAVVFSDFTDSKCCKTYVTCIARAEQYIPGQFYKRELPCLLAILAKIEENIETIVIDGYVDLDENPGLGRHLWKALDCKKTIIGMAKKYFRGSNAIKVFRGKSRQPLFVTAAGIEQTVAAGLIAKMHGKYRIPGLIKQADQLSRRR